ncbi:DEAD/DEAH box helicase [Thiocapsa imhoffii]|uniref:DEAD/DEAH box helicase n=1 Tax=Thiocapsa imhoffii TaxID=382777 RepID=UPI001F5BC2DE|nr:DEAD/DEAH box helicase [Thiocapsa imhoffii]
MLDTEQIEALASSAVVRLGLRYASEYRVVALERMEAGLYARVEDGETEEKLALEIVRHRDGRLLAACECDEATLDTLCVHAIAALFAYSKGQGHEPIDPSCRADARRAALEERLARARAEVRVDPLSESASASGFGLWRARSLQSATHYSSDYRVHIRFLTRRANHCTCPDFATNELGTCKHVEAVLHHLRKRRDFKQISQMPSPRGAVVLDWEADPAPLLRLHRGAEMSIDLQPLLHEHFDADGRFRLRLPDDFLRFVDLVAGHPDLDIGDDALAYARRLAEDGARAIRAAEIGERIRAGGGRLPGVQAKLYPYQTEGVAFLAGRGRALLADDMGLGKTLQGIAAAYWLHLHEGVERVLVICPASLKRQWAREIERFTGACAQVIEGPAAARGVQYRKGTGFYVVNYELVMRDLAVINSELRPDLMILDEAQRIKNWRTKIASTVKQIGSRYAFVLTGTPLENRLEDLYSLMQVINARVLGPLWRYMVDFHITDERGKVLGYRNLSELRRRLAPVMLRRDRSLVRDQLPERIVTRIDAPLSPAQQQIHDDALQAAASLAQISTRRPLTPSEQNRMMAALQRARMACNAAALVDPSMAESHPSSAPKLDELETILDEVCTLSGLKVVVFSQWAMMTELVEQRVRRLGLGSVRLHGGIPSAHRGALIDRFRADDAVQVFISTDAGGVGLNLQNASVLINLDIPWNPAVLDQRIARVHRLGQRQKVQAILMVAPDSYEERVLTLVQGKRELFNNVVDADASEDVVSVSKRLAEILAEDLAARAEPVAAAETPAVAKDLAGTRIDPDAGAAPVSLAPDPVGATAGRADVAPTVPDLDDAVRECVIGLQQAFGQRITRVLGQRRRGEDGGLGGLLVVMDRVEESDDAVASRLSSRVPIALIDRRTLDALSRLGGVSPLADADALYDQVEEGADVSAPSEAPLMRKARDGLGAARLLIQQGCPGPALDLIVAALLSTAACRAGLAHPPSPAQAAVWLYGEALPAGLLEPSEGALLMRAIGLAQARDAVPESMLQGLAEDAAGFLDAARSWRL